MLPLETDRLLLRPLRDDDVDWLADLYEEAGAPRDAAPRELAQALEHEREHGYGHLVAASRDSGELVAVVELHRAGDGLVGIEPDEVEIGWVVAEAHRGHGIATEAAAAAASYALATIAADHLVAYVRPANAASLRVVEKIGMRRRSAGRSRSGDPMEVFELRTEEVGRAPR